MYLSKFRDFLVLIYCEMVLNFNSLCFFRGQLDLQMMRMSHSFICELKTLFEVS